MGFSRIVRFVRRLILRPLLAENAMDERTGSRRTRVMSTCLSPEALKKAAILSAIDQYDDAAYGLKRLQKVIYRASKEASVKPFSYCVWRFGQHSRDMTAMLSDMVRDGLVIAEDLPRKTGKSYRLSPVGLAVKECLEPVDRVLPGFGKGLHVAMREVGLQKDSAIDRWAKGSPEVKGRPQGTPLMAEDLPRSTDNLGLNDGQIEDLELALNTGFVSSVCKVMDAMKESDLNLSAIHEWNGEPSVSASGS